jgi:hypothetical protein
MAEMEQEEQKNPETACKEISPEYCKHSVTVNPYHGKARWVEVDREPWGA